jgi:hypothetical protein
MVLDTPSQPQCHEKSVLAPYPHHALRRQGVALVLANVNPQPLSLIKRSGIEDRLGAEHIVPTLSEAPASTNPGAIPPPAG